MSILTGDMSPTSGQFLSSISFFSFFFFTCFSHLWSSFCWKTGDAWVGGRSVITASADVCAQLGYCPQLECHLEVLTARQQLHVYARLKGVADPERRRTLIENMLQVGGLFFFVEFTVSNICLADAGVEWARRRADTASIWGQQTEAGFGRCTRRCTECDLSWRYASYFIANVWSFYVCNLEPSTGVDPVSRRFMWRIISAAKQERAVLLTTHMMEEADAVCDSIGIMVNGGGIFSWCCTFLLFFALLFLSSAVLWFVAVSESKVWAGLSSWNSNRRRCWVFPQVLVVTVFVVFPVLPKKIDRVTSFVSQIAPNSKVDECFGGKFCFSLPKLHLSLPSIFRHLEHNRQTLHMRYFSLSQSSLEQVFVSLAKDQAASFD